LKKKLLSICLSVAIAVALIVVMFPGCEGETVTYDLTTGSGTGGQVTGPGEGTNTYDDGEVVDLVATPDCGYAFDNWTGDTGTIDDVNAAVTNITMNADYDINANFKPIPADHYKFYDVYSEEPVPIGAEVTLEDQFDKFTTTVMNAMVFGNPVEKEHATAITPIHDPDRHYTIYWLDLNESDWVRRSVEVSNQFNDAAEPQTLTVLGPVALAVPTQKEGHEMVECLNHYLLYWVEEYTGAPEVGVNLKDQFIPDGEDVTVYEPLMFGNPVKKTVVENGDVSEIEDADLHWVLYNIGEGDPASIQKPIQIANQFGDNQVLDLTYRDMLAVPSEKNVPPTPPLDHFKCYNATGPAPGGTEELWVNLKDQFHDNYIEAQVLDPILFCNPVDKVHGSVTTTSNPDNHLTVYKLGGAMPHIYSVTIDNQFSDAGAQQTLTVMGPVALAVPTQKLIPGDHGMPKYVDHYLLYQVTAGSEVNVTVDLDDEFDGSAPGVEVTKPIYFANPCLKGYVDFEGIWDPDEHLVFYEISDNDEYLPSVMIRNQFFPDEGVPLELFDNWELLGVPSVKVDWQLVD
jgi:hypothetical protein